MNQEVNIDNKKKKLKIYYSLLITVICIIGVSFAWFRLYLSQSEDNTLASRTCFSTTLTEDTSKIELTDAFPISNEDGLKGTPFTFTIKNNCDSYVKAYITIKSTYRTSTDSSYLKDNYIKVNISLKGTTKNPSLILGSQTLTDLDNDSKGYIIVDTGLNSNEEKSYDLRIWMDSATTLEQGLDKTWAGKIVVLTSAVKEPPAAPDGWYDAPTGTLIASLRGNNDLKIPLTVLGKETSAHTKDDVESDTISVASTYQKYYVTYGTGWEANGEKFNLTGTAVTSDTYANSYSSLVGKYLASYFIPVAGSSTAGTMKNTTDLSSIYYVVSATSSSFVYKQITSNKNKTEALMASAEDDYGTSYYFRGAVRNNYVQFANKCWRIVRITGNGSVKLVLHNDNTSKAPNPCSSSNNGVTAAFAHYNGSVYESAFNSSNSDNTYVGFMYGTAGSSSYTSTHANTNKSTILTNLETWYENNLASYESKLADTIWCNDKDTITIFISGKIEENYGGGPGYGTNDTRGYGAYNRLYYKQIPSLICPGRESVKLSKYTVSDTNNGNGNLTYKVGLLTADEIAYSGLKSNTYNRSTYLQENTGTNYWWSLSPGAFINTAKVWHVSSGYLDFGANDNVSSSYGIRPSISLVSDITISGGTGTSEDPYIVN